MGFTPLAGVMMGTRSGEMDPSVISYMLESDPSLRSAQDVIDVLNKNLAYLVYQSFQVICVT